MEHHDHDITAKVKRSQYTHTTLLPRSMDALDHNSASLRARI